MSKIKELPYKQGIDCRSNGGHTKDNPYWDGYEKDGMEWAFHSWLHGWEDCDIALQNKLKEKNEFNG